MMENSQEEIRTIRNQLRLAMNGVVSASMREKGVVYKLNFGVSYPEIQSIARSHKPATELAEALWKEDIREFKILATLLRPVESFPIEEAKRWVREIPYLEIAEHCARNLFVRLPYRKELSLDLISGESPFARTEAFLLWANMFKQGEELSGHSLEVFLEESSRSATWKSYEAAMNERFAALQAMRLYGRLSDSNARRILERIKDSLNSQEDSADLQEIYNDLKFEFDYYK